MDMHVKSMHNVGTRHMDIIYAHHTEIYGILRKKLGGIFPGTDQFPVECRFHTAFCMHYFSEDFDLFSSNYGAQTKYCRTYNGSSLQRMFHVFSLLSWIVFQEILTELYQQLKEATEKCLKIFHIVSKRCRIILEFSKDTVDLRRFLPVETMEQR